MNFGKLQLLQKTQKNILFQNEIFMIFAYILAFEQRLNLSPYNQPMHFYSKTQLLKVLDADSLHYRKNWRNNAHGLVTLQKYLVQIFTITHLRYAVHCCAKLMVCCLIFLYQNTYLYILKFLNMLLKIYYNFHNFVHSILNYFQEMIPLLDKHYYHSKMMKN